MEYCLLTWILSLSYGGDASLFFRGIMPVSGHVYNYVSQYVILALIFPLFAHRLARLNKKQYTGLIIVFWGIVELIPNLFGLTFVCNSIVLPLFFAFVGGWIKEYSNDIEKHKVIFRIQATLIVIGLAIVIFMFPTLYDKYIGTYSIATFLFSLFLFTETSSKYTKVNWQGLSQTMFGVFVWHDNPVFRIWLWSVIFKIPAIANSDVSINYIVFKSLLSSCLIFFSGIIIEYIRMKIDSVLSWILHNIEGWNYLNTKIDNFYNDTKNV